jgi:hypothetical protein
VPPNCLARWRKQARLYGSCFLLRCEGKSIAWRGRQSRNADRIASEVRQSRRNSHSKLAPAGDATSKINRLYRLYLFFSDTGDSLRATPYANPPLSFGILIHSCQHQTQRSPLGQISISRVGQYSISVNNQLLLRHQNGVDDMDNAIVSCDIGLGHVRLFDHHFASFGLDGQRGAFDRLDLAWLDVSSHDLA